MSASMRKPSVLKMNTWHDTGDNLQQMHYSAQCTRDFYLPFAEVFFGGEQSGTDQTQSPED